MVTVGDKIDYNKGQWIVAIALPDKSLIYVEKEALRNQGKGEWLRVVGNGFVPLDITDGGPLIHLPIGSVK